MLLALTFVAPKLYLPPYICIKLALLNFFNPSHKALQSMVFRSFFLVLLLYNSPQSCSYLSRARASGVGKGCKSCGQWCSPSIPRCSTHASILQTTRRTFMDVTWGFCFQLHQDEVQIWGTERNCMLTCWKLQSCVGIWSIKFMALGQWTVP